MHPPLCPRQRAPWQIGRLDKHRLASWSPGESSHPQRVVGRLAAHVEVPVVRLDEGELPVFQDHQQLVAGLRRHGVDHLVAQPDLARVVAETVPVGCPVAVEIQSAVQSPLNNLGVAGQENGSGFRRESYTGKHAFCRYPLCSPCYVSRTSSCRTSQTNNSTCTDAQNLHNTYSALLLMLTKK